MSTRIIRTYSELIQLPSFEERFKYLQLRGQIGIETFGFDRYLNQEFYRSNEWKDIKKYVIVRDNGWDLGVEGHDIFDRIIVHHMNPITIDDIKYSTNFLLDPEYLISTSIFTHNGLHYGDTKPITNVLIERKPNDTCPWKRKEG